MRSKLVRHGIWVLQETEEVRERASVVGHVIFVSKGHWGIHVYAIEKILTEKVTI